MIRESLVAALCAPLLLWQALSLRRRARRLPEAAGPRHGSLGAGPPLHLLIVGNSSAAGVGVARQDQALAGQLSLALSARVRLHWRLRAQTGHTTRDALAALRGAPLGRVEVAVVVLGGNDVPHLARQRRWLRDHAALRALLRGAGARRIYVSQVPPLDAFPLLPQPLRWLLGRRSARFDAALRRALLGERDCHHVPLPDALDPADMAEDGFHPGPRIYAEWARNLARQILANGPI